MSSSSDRRDDVDGEEDLEDVVDQLQEDLDRLEEMVGENVAGLHARLSSLEDRLDGYEKKIDELEHETKVATATADRKKESKIEKATKVLEAADRKHGGPVGVSIDTGEVLGAAECSRSRSTGLMDEIAGAIDGAETRTPGGPNPKALRLPIGERSVDELIDELIEAWGDKEVEGD